MKSKVLILDFGSQYTQLIARRVREEKVYCEVFPFNASLDRMRAFAPGAVILSGGPSSVYAQGAPHMDAGVLDLGVPVLGICYGLQSLAVVHGMRVEPAEEREYGLARLEVVQNSALLEGIPDGTQVWMSHGDKLSGLPGDFVQTARTRNTDMAVIESVGRRQYGVQFHPEVVHTVHGRQLIHNFLFRISGLEPDWNMSDFIEETIRSIRERVGSEQILLGLSGGVDSTVLALLLHRAIGPQLVPVFVDTGLLRQDEYEDLMDRFHNDLQLNVIGMRAGDLFLKRLRGVRQPEKKRKIIGATFIDVFANIEEEVGKIRFFAQGTLYPDVIESVSVRGPAATIKSHHNVGWLPEKMSWELVEPFRELFKDEVRAIGRELGLDESFLRRHPFPGPGLAVRILGAVSAPKVRRLQEADAILQEEMERFGVYDRVWQAFTVLLPVRSVGVMGDERTYENAVVIRMVESVDGMTADWYEAPADFLRAVATRIVNEVKGINRVTYDLTSKPPGTIEWE